MFLYFQNSKGKERLLGKPNTIEECDTLIQNFLDEHNFKHIYTRCYEEDGRLKIDVGSWSEFFYIEGLSFNEFIDYNYNKKDCSG